MNFYKLYNLIENQNFFKNFSFIDKIITQTHAKEIYNLLLGMFPEAKQIIDYQYREESGKPFAEWRRMIFEIENHVLNGPEMIDPKLINIDHETNKDRQAKFDQYVKDKQEGKYAQYFRKDMSDPRTVDFAKMPPITVIEENGVYDIVDGAHRAFLAKRLNKPLNAYIWKQRNNNHPNVAKIKALFNSQP